MVLFLVACSAPSSAPAPAPLAPTPSEQARPATESRVFPILQPYGWSEKATALHEPFAGADKPPVPVIGYGYAIDGKTVYLQQEGDRSLDEVKAEAQKNIEAWASVWDPVNPRVLTASGKRYSSEKLLDPGFLKKAQETLGAQRILVGVPRRTVLYAVNADAAPADMDEFIEVFDYTWKDDSYGNDALSNLLFEFTDGEMTGAKLVE
jgi:hypothetical protein